MSGKSIKTAASNQPGVDMPGSYEESYDDSMYNKSGKRKKMKNMKSMKPMKGYGKNKGGY